MRDNDNEELLYSSVIPDKVEKVENQGGSLKDEVNQPKKDLIN